MTTAELKTQYIKLVEELEDLVDTAEILMQGDKHYIRASLAKLKKLLKWY